MSSSSSLTLEIRSPSHPTSLTLQTTPSATIAAIKEQLTARHPLHPLANDQRLIFQGKLLGDSEVIGTILDRSNIQDSIQVLHLVVRPNATSLSTTVPKPEAENSKNANKDTNQNQQHQVNPLETSSGDMQQPTQQDQSPSLQSFSQITFLGNPFQYVLINGMPYLMVFPPSTSVSPSNQSPAQNEQAYPRFIWQNQNAWPIPHHYHPQQQNQQAQTTEAPQRVALTQEAIAQRNARRSAALMLGLKLAFFLYIFCQGVSFTRALILHLLAVGFWLWQTGMLRFTLRVGVVQGREGGVEPAIAAAQGVPPAQQAPPQPQATQAPQQEAAQDQAAPQQEGAPVSAGHQQPQAQREAEPSLLRKVEHALLTFLTSLIPGFGAAGLDGAGLEGAAGQDEGMGGDGFAF